MNKDEKSSRLLVAEDSVDQLRLLVQILSQAGHVVSVATDGAQAYARTITWKPDLILMDVRMPKMNGIAVTRRLKQSPDTQNIPIIFISAATTIEEKLEGLRSGACDYVTKPFDEREVLERVRIHLQLSQEASEPDTLEPATGGLRSEHEVLFRAATRLITSHLYDPLTSTELAALLSSSERRISAAFSACASMSVSAYTRQAIMQRAQALLAQTDLSIEIIADELGYSSGANFSTAFKEHFGKAPSVVRKKQKS